MKGSIHSDQTCPQCGSRFKSVEPRGLFCPNHPKQQPTTFKVMFCKITRRFNDYQSALQFLTGLRFQDGSGQLDERDYKIKAKPLGFANLAQEWLATKKNVIRPGSYRPYCNAIARAEIAWGNVNIKSITYAHIEDLLNGLNLAPKTKSMTLSTLKQFWTWAVARYDIPELKAWPVLGSPEMRFRKTVSVPDQELILNEIKRLTAKSCPRTWLAIKWLCTYPSIRPGEMISITEGQIDRRQGLVLIPHPKERKPKLVPLLDDDIKLLDNFPEEHPSLPFFRHDKGEHAGKNFSPSQLYRNWKKACKNLGIVGVDLYGGTKHSTAMGLRQVATFEEVRKMTGHTTNRAFDRYLQLEGETMKALISGVVSY